jgi:hypothetical protein
VALLSANWNCVALPCIHSTIGQGTKLLPKPALYTIGIHCDLYSVANSHFSNTCAYLSKLCIRKTAFCHGPAGKSGFRFFYGRRRESPDLIPGEKTMSAITPSQGDVPSPTTLLAIQTGGGLLTLLPIISLNQFAMLAESLYRVLVAAAVANVVISATILVGFVGNLRRVRAVIDRIGQIGVCRMLIFYDIIMLGGLVYLTGGSEDSAFVPQFAAVLPMAMLIRDSSAMKWTYASIFLFMFLLGLQTNELFHGYIKDSEIKERWFLVFFFIFTIFPVIYSIQTERTT